MQYAQTYVVSVSPEKVIEKVVLWGSGFANTNIQTSGSTVTFTYSRKFIPGWAVALGIVGLLFFLIGVVFFFVRKTEIEVFTVTALPIPGGSQVTMGGIGQPWLIQRMQNLMATSPPMAASIGSSEMPAPPK